MATRKQLAKKTYLDNGVTFTFPDGTSRTVTSELFPAAIQKLLLVYGIGQKIGDAYAGAKSPRNAADEVDAMVAQLVAGNWKATREGGEPKAGKTVRALFNLGEIGGVTVTKDGKRQKVSAEQYRSKLAVMIGVTGDWSLPSVRDAYAKADENLRKVIAGSPDVKLEMARMSAEEAAESGASLMS